MKMRRGTCIIEDRYEDAANDQVTLEFNINSKHVRCEMRIRPYEVYSGVAKVTVDGVLLDQIENSAISAVVSSILSIVNTVRRMP
jgi:hypothetical protein